MKKIRAMFSFPKTDSVKGRKMGAALSGLSPCVDDNPGRGPGLASARLSGFEAVHVANSTSHLRQARTRRRSKLSGQRGVALVITLIMLSVITFLTVAFLALSRRERGATATAQSQTDAKLMTEIATARVQAELAAKIMAKNHMLVNDLMVSRNYIRKEGFTNTQPPGVVDTNNVNYDYRSDGQPLSQTEKYLNLANLFFDPRPPVFIKTNEVAPTNDFRFYRDVNRNGRFETNGVWPVIDDNSNPIGEADFTGDPEWIGVLERPELPHSPSNRFVGRYSYLVLPEGKSMDFNTAHNYAKGNNGLAATMPYGNDGFYRNQGFGAWELNLAGLFYHVNTNYWGLSQTPPYLLTNAFTYKTNNVLANGGANDPAFTDALSFLRYRYRTNYNNQPTAMETLGINGGLAYEADNVDGYADGPLALLTLSLTNEPSALTGDAAAEPWAGGRNTNAYYDYDELFDTNKVSPEFVSRLQTMSTRTNSYDRYSFYRMLAQIGTHSTPDRSRMHLNYDNLVQTNAQGIKSATNFFEWEPLAFFTNAAERLIQRSLDSMRDGNGNLTNKYFGDTNFLVGTNFSITHIPIYPTNLYSSPIHRLLQVAANIYAATTNGAVAGTTNNFPYVFRPRFGSDGSNVFISGYVEVTTDWSNQLQQPFLDLNYATNRSALTADANVFGVPWVISAKKGLPNLNEFTAESRVEVTRKLQMTNAPGGRLTNQMLILSISNSFGVEIWHSYRDAYPRSLYVRATNYFDAALTNESGNVMQLTGSPLRLSTNVGSDFVLSDGLPGGKPPTNLYSAGILFLTNSQYLSGGTFRPVPNINRVQFESPSGYPQPNWNLLTTNRLVYAMADTQANRLVDFVNVVQIQPPLYITNVLYHLAHLKIEDRDNGPFYTYSEFWNPQRRDRSSNISVTTEGVQNQIRANLGYNSVWVRKYDEFYEPSGETKRKEVIKFAKFLGISPADPNLIRHVDWQSVQTPKNSVDVPWNPTMEIIQRASFQANDPLVHYMAEDLSPAPQTLKPPEGKRIEISNEQIANPTSNLGLENITYKPWGKPANDTHLQYNRGYKDPLVDSSDGWNFPTNKFASIGWIGRVHRGTPWQTIYLKAMAGSVNDVVDTNRWATNWAGSYYSYPTNDWKLIDLFTTAPNDIAARGLVSVNQANYGAWSAALSGLVVLSNSLAVARDGVQPRFTNVVIHPSEGVTNGGHWSGSYVNIIVDAINNKRGSGAFSTMGEILSAEELTVKSPFLNWTNAALGVVDLEQQQYGISDEAYERLPQMLFSLLRVGEPRFVVYSYGQSLKPAENSILVDPPLGLSRLQNLCTNYQITGEMATRTVLRVDGTPEKPKVVVESFKILSEE